MFPGSQVLQGDSARFYLVNRLSPKTKSAQNRGKGGRPRIAGDTIRVQTVIAKMQNPSQRAEAKARLDATLKKLEAAKGRSFAGSRSFSGRDRALDRDQDFER